MDNPMESMDGSPHLDAEELKLERVWTLYLKKNCDDWKPDSFHKLYNIATVADIWKVWHNIPENLCSWVNLFFMEHDLFPLYERHEDIFRAGGCWSIIVKGRSWLSSLQTLILTVFGETEEAFDRRFVKGICVVPVSPNHCIMKLWVTTSAPAVGKIFHDTLLKFDICPPRFKAFAK